MIELKNISKNFKNVNLFSNINYIFEDGVCYGLIGRNGSGKSVLLRLIAGFSKPDAGEIIIDNEVLGEKVDFIQNAGICINHPEFMVGWSGYDNLMYLAEIRKKIGEKEVIDWVDRLGLTDDIKRKYKTYSQGMRQKMRIIQALMEDPQYILMDEPFNALDEQSVEVVYQIFEEFKSASKTIIFTSHDSADIEGLSDKILSVEQFKSATKVNSQVI